PSRWIPDRRHGEGRDEVSHGLYQALARCGFGPSTPTGNNIQAASAASFSPAPMISAHAAAHDRRAGMLVCGDCQPRTIANAQPAADHRADSRYRTDDAP